MLLLLMANLLAVFLYARFSGFIRGESFAIAVYTNIDKYAGFFPKVPDIYQKFSENYLTIASLLFGLLVVHLFTRKIIFDWFKFFVSVIALFVYGQLFYPKLSLVQDYELSRFTFVRDMFPFDITLLILMALIVLSQILAYVVKNAFVVSERISVDVSKLERRVVEDKH